MIVDLSPEQIARVEALCKALEETEPLDPGEAEAKRSAWFASLTEKILAGQTFNQASGGPDILNKGEEEFRTLMRNAANDIDFQVEQTQHWLDGHWRNGDVIAPHYPKRIAIILRKAERVDLEVRFLRALSRHMQGFVVERLPKAIALHKRRT